ncbi:2379_t:CDS:2 [Funneliformis caledonium]|uniref:2379_t:CDS:1 n=1 Tax=Funneliformis caledonium TaxID=1117310 RepID=A0A9N9GKR7_9GLOM|nr:2379_t:CDS:2 [Funneliformis caledonium]
MDSCIITYKHEELITKWIEKLEITDQISASYEFKLLARERDSFIFSFKDKNDVNNHILSRVKNEQRATYNCSSCGPAFGYSDLIISPFYGNKCIMSDYEKPIRETGDKFRVEICEIFLIAKN